MRLAYLILAHKDPAQIERLMRAILDPDNVYLIHVDRKSDEACHRLAAGLAARHANVAVMPARDVRWASFSVIDTTIRGIRQLLEMSPDWQFFFNLSGQDFPLRTQAQIRERLSAFPGRNFVEHFDPMEKWVDAQARIRRIRIEPPFSASGYNLPKIRIDRWSHYLGDAEYRGGWSYFTLDRRFCEFMTRSPLLARYRRFFRYTYTSDEILIPTFILNSPLRDTVINDCLRQFTWIEGEAQPRIYTMDDRERLLASPALFARKFDLGADAGIVELLEDRLRSGATARRVPLRRVA